MLRKAKKVETLVHVFLYHVSTGSRKHLLFEKNVPGGVRTHGIRITQMSHKNLTSLIRTARYHCATGMDFAIFERQGVPVSEVSSTEVKALFDENSLLSVFIKPPKKGKERVFVMKPTNVRSSDRR